jgi:ssDNA-binding replication factor A large subunit
MTRRRSKLSAIAPDTSENNMTGRVVDAWTSATMSSEAAIDVISQAEPTD